MTYKWLNKLRTIPKIIWITPIMIDIFIFSEFSKTILFLATWFKKRSLKNHRNNLNSSKILLIIVALIKFLVYFSLKKKR